MRLFQLTVPARPALLTLASSDDCILLRQDAVYLLLTAQDWPCRLCVLEKDLVSRGIANHQHVELISDTQWVELTLQATQVISCQN